MRPLGNIRPLLSALLRSRTGALLVTAQVAVALAIGVNGAYIAKQHLDKIERPTGMDVANIFVVSTAGFTSRFDYLPAVRADLAYLRGLDGVTAATTINGLPLTLYGPGISVTAKPADRRLGAFASYFDIDEQGIAALGVRLAAGRPFLRDEVGPPQGNAARFAPQVIVTRDLARQIFPNGDALGRDVYLPGGTSPGRIVGIIDHMQGSFLGLRTVGNVVLGARPPNVDRTGTYYYLVRTRPGMRDRVMRAAEEHLAQSNRDRIIDWVQPLGAIEDRSYATDVALAGFLSAVALLLLGIAGLGIFALANFQVTMRTRQIGTRRALGATRLDVVMHFMIENGLVTVAGVVAGSLLALAAGYWLSVEEHLPRLDLYYLVGGILILCAIGQLAAWRPARRAAKVSPAVATRTV